MSAPLSDEIRKLCQQASQESDPAKLVALVQRINELFSEGDTQTKSPDSSHSTAA